MDSLTAYHFAFDGELLGRQELRISLLSSRWLGVCTELLAAHGPVFDVAMGGTLEHFRIKCTAGICQFSVSGLPVLFAVLVASSSETQATALLSLFASQVCAVPLVREHCIDLTVFQDQLASVRERPAFIGVDWLNPEVSEQDQEAAFQLAIHLAGAYQQWFGAAQQLVQADK